MSPTNNLFHWLITLSSKWSQGVHFRIKLDDVKNNETLFQIFSILCWPYLNLNNFRQNGLCEKNVCTFNYSFGLKFYKVTQEPIRYATSYSTFNELGHLRQLLTMKNHLCIKYKLYISMFLHVYQSAFLNDFDSLYYCYAYKRTLFIRHWR